jgi:branched-chain amino acid transport system ATP-binding protein
MAKINLDQVKNAFLKSQLEKVEHQIVMLEEYLPLYQIQLHQKHTRKIEDLTAKNQKIIEKMAYQSLSKDDKINYLLNEASKRFDQKHYWKLRAIHQELNVASQTDQTETIKLAKQRHQDALIELEDKKTQMLSRLNEKLKAKNNLSITTVQHDDVRVKQDELQNQLTDFINNLSLKEQTIIEKLSTRSKRKKEKLIIRHKTISTQIESILHNDQVLSSLKLDALVEQEQNLTDFDKKSEMNQQIDHLRTKLQMEKEDNDIHLSISHLTMSFAGLKAVDDLSFSVKKESIFGLIGPNGAGKTTVFNCITQFYKPSHGQIYYHSPKGEIISLLDYKVHDVIKQGIVRTFQNVELIWELNILDNMLVGAHTQYKTGFFTHLLHLKSLKREEEVIRAKALKVLESLDLLHYKDFYPLGLPYGILKKIELARTLMSNPKLIILDEPAAGLNDVETKSLAQTIKKIRDTYHCTIFLVEHDMELVMDICDEICAISFGKKLAIGSPKDIQKNPIVQEAYLGGE